MVLLVDIIGMAGAAALLYAYAMLSMRKLSGDGLTYQVINLGGALALMVNSAVHSAWPSALLNLVWCCIGLMALWRLPALRWRRRHVSDGSSAGH